MRGVRVKLYESPRHTGGRMVLLFKCVVGFLLVATAVWVVFWLGVALVYLIVTIVESIGKMLR
jgi:predicted phage tail protein